MVAEGAEGRGGGRRWCRGPRAVAEGGGGFDREEMQIDEIENSEERKGMGTLYAGPLLPVGKPSRE